MANMEPQNHHGNETEHHFPNLQLLGCMMFHLLHSGVYQVYHVIFPAFHFGRHNVWGPTIHAECPSLRFDELAPQGCISCVEDSAVEP